MDKRKIQIEQLEPKLQLFKEAGALPAPPTGWVRSIRSALGMTLEQLAKRMNSSKQSISELEKREKEGTITLKLLRETAHALEMDLVYGFVPKAGSLEQLIDEKAYELTKKIVLRTSHTMKLEDQENSETRIKKAFQERLQKIKLDLPKALWD
jgi:predicted DNA-binding mobile mystery protein A